MKKGNGLYLLYKKLGETPLEAIGRAKKRSPVLKNEKMTYAGRLDPMAEGLLILLYSKKLMHKEKYTKLQKTYQFGILWGIETDTGDILGKVKSQDSNSKLENIEKYIKKSVGKFKQKYPAFSSKTVDGVPLWVHTRGKREVKLPEHEVELFSAKFLNEKKVNSKRLLKTIINRIRKVKGDFRQEEILKKWQAVLQMENNFKISWIEAKVSSGFYIRQFSSDLAKKLGTVGLAYEIKRTKIGKYTPEDCE